MRIARPTLRSGVLLLALGALSLTACDRGDHPARIGSPAPQFTLTDGGQTVSLASLRGHTVVLNFWATWCVPCVEELPSLLVLHHRLPQITILAICQDEDPAAYRQFLLDNHVDFLTLRDPSARVPHLYGTIKIPETYIIDRKGILRRKFVSAQDWTSPEVLDYLSKL
ncbi:MAG TPA: TlpA disulfide reductase family protein [Acidobacteriaceae bacterium]|nr:TlpA disulfide reductase family protein [Acidobacteriaceae bacterium]